MGFAVNMGSDESVHQTPELARTWGQKNAFF